MNLGLVLRRMLGHGAPRGYAEARKGCLWLVAAVGALVMVVVMRIVAVSRVLRGRYHAGSGGWCGAPQTAGG